MSKRLYQVSLIVLGLSLVLGLLGSSPALAQEPPDRPPVPPVEGGGKGGGRNDGDHGQGGGSALPVGPTNGAVSGYVHDYSGHVAAAGVTVVLAGGGWQAEAVTDSNGYYRMAGLGAGRGIINLRLPPGTHPVVFDWPVTPGRDGARVDLGYYWGDASPLPATVSAELGDGRLAIQVTNQTDRPLTGSRVEVLLPAGVRGEPGIQASQGGLGLYDSHDLEINLGELAAGAGATITVPLSSVEGQARTRQAGQIQVILTYDQQVTPIMTAVAAEGVAPAAPAQPPAAPAGAAPPIRMEPLPETGALTFRQPGFLEVVLPLGLGVSLTLAGLRALGRRRD